jgi:hypothetical protein
MPGIVVLVLKLKHLLISRVHFMQQRDILYSIFHHGDKIMSSSSSLNNFQVEELNRTCHQPYYDGNLPQGLSIRLAWNLLRLSFKRRH